MQKPLYKRILLKISGEALMGEQEFGLKKNICLQIAEAIKEVRALEVEVAIVVGGGNIFRGSQAKEFGFARVAADQIGMLATTINGLVLQQTLNSLGVPCSIMSAFPCEGVFETYTYGRALHHLNKGRVLIFVGGTGHPYFTTDTAAALRASEIGADVLLKATKVAGIYDSDPHKNPHAKKYDRLTYSEALIHRLKVMDATAFALCRENHLPIYVFNLFDEQALMNAVCQQKSGTLVTE